jgi:hypothetical protein
VRRRATAEKLNDYKKYRNYVNRMVVEHKIALVEKDFEKAYAGSAQWWKAARRHFVGHCNSMCISHLVHDNVTTADRSEMASTFVQHFEQMYSAKRTEEPRTENPTRTLTDRSEQLKAGYGISESLVELLIQNTPTGKSNLEKIPTRILKVVSKFILAPLTSLIRRSLTEGCMPSCLKVARVVPLHKTGRKDLAANYRPISLLSIFATITEKAAYSIIDRHITVNKLIDENQFGFKRHHSCVHAVLHHLSTVHSYLDERKHVGSLYIDIRNAFPTVDHEVLLRKIETTCGGLGMPQKWFSSYLEDRTMYVDLDGVHSQTVNISRGVPQGSVLGPVLFSVYYNDVISEFDHNSVTLFADDTAITATGCDYLQLIENLQSRLTRIDEFLSSLNMELNASKTTFITFLSEAENTLLVKNGSVNSCRSFKYLGVNIDYDMSWQTHVSLLIQRVQKSLYVLHRCKGASNMLRRQQLFRAYIYPHFLYGIQCYMFCSVSLRAKLESLFRRCCRLVLRDTGCFPMVSCKSLYTSLDVLPLRLMFQHSSAVILFNVLVLHHVPSLEALFTRSARTHVNTRHVHSDIIELRIPLVRTERAKQSFAFWGARLWNSIPPVIRNCSSLSVFSRLYSVHLRSCLDVALDVHYHLLDFV